jgi:hypothetical protein
MPKMLRQTIIRTIQKDALIKLFEINLTNDELTRFFLFESDFRTLLVNCLSKTDIFKSFINILTLRESISDYDINLNNTELTIINEFNDKNILSNDILTEKNNISNDILTDKNNISNDILTDKNNISNDILRDKNDLDKNIKIINLINQYTNKKQNVCNFTINRNKNLYSSNRTLKKR